MGLFDDGLFGDLFDFNGDGVTDPGEAFIAFNIFNEVTGENKEDEEDDE